MIAPAEQSQPEQPWYDTVAIPALLRHARTTYGVAMRGALEAAGYDDLPRNGLYVIGGLALNREGISLSSLIRELRISKQSAGQLVDALVLRGYLERTVDPEDRRRLTVALTARGEAAAAAQGAARERIDAELLARIGAEDVAALRRGLGALVGIAHGTDEEAMEGGGESA